MIGIYCIQNTLDGKKYIGKSSDITHRWNNHKSDLRRNRHNNIHLQRAWNKYGSEVFRFFILSQTDCELDAKEEFWINFFRTTSDKQGYNINPRSRGEGSMSDETKKKLSIAAKEQWKHNKGNIRESVKASNSEGRKKWWQDLSDEQRQRYIDAYIKGHEAHRKKFSASGPEAARQRSPMILQIKDDQVIKEWKLCEAVKTYGNHVYACVNGIKHRKTAYGFSWRIK